jgi:hypothetical protein
MFTILLFLVALLVAGCAAYFSVLGIATLFSGHYLQVLIMAGSLELGKLVATSFLYRYWKHTTLFLKLYMVLAVLILMGITSMGIYGYLSSGFQVNAGKLDTIEKQALLIEQQKINITNEIEQNNKRVNTLNQARATQEQRLPKMSRESAKPVYEDMARAAEEIKNLSARNQSLQDSLLTKDAEILGLQKQNVEVHDIGTFKFVAESLNLPLETIVKLFIIVIVCVFDPLAVSLILAYNIASGGSILKNKENEKELEATLIPEPENQDSDLTQDSSNTKQQIKFSVVNATGKMKK